METTHNCTSPKNDKEKYDFEEQEFINANKLIFLDKEGWPVEGIISDRFATILRRLIFTTRIVRYKTWRKNGGCAINFKK